MPAEDPDHVAKPDGPTGATGSTGEGSAEGETDRQKQLFDAAMDADSVLEDDSLLTPAPGRPSSGAHPSSPSAGGWEPPTPGALQSEMPGYEVHSLLGRGGMGAVYKARQTNLDRLVAVKVLPPTLEDVGDGVGFAERFRQEARAMARLSHPAIVAVHDFGETPEGLLYFAMEFVEGMDILEYLRLNGGTLEPDSALAICAHVLDALDYAHRRGVVHRDIKPANVLIDTEGRVRVADFGLAKRLAGGDESLLALRTLSGIAMGTPAYMAPECLDPEVPADHRVDLYAVGVMLYQMLTGKLPQGLFEMPSEANPEIDPRFDELLERALEADPGFRIGTATEFRLGLDAILSQPVAKAEERSQVAPMTAALEAAEAEAEAEGEEAEADGSANAPSATRTAEASRKSRTSQLSKRAHPQRSTGVAARRETATRRRRAGAGTWAVAAGGAVALALAAAALFRGQADKEEPLAEAASVRMPGDGVLSRPEIRVPPVPPEEPRTGDEAPAGLTQAASPPAPAAWPPNDAHYRSQGRFRAWSSLPDDPATDLSSLAGIEDAKEVVIGGRGWAVLRQSGELVRSGESETIPGIRSLHRSQDRFYAAVTEDGRLLALETGGEGLEVPEGLGPVREAFVTPVHSAALLEDGGLAVWGHAHENPDHPHAWAETPALPPGRKAVALATSPAVVAVRLDDGSVLVWHRRFGRLDLPAQFSGPDVTGLTASIENLFAIRSGAPPLEFGLVEREPPYVMFERLEAATHFEYSGIGLFMLDREGRPTASGSANEGVPGLLEATARVRVVDPAHFSMHRWSVNPRPGGDSARFLWFDGGDPAERSQESLTQAASRMEALGDEEEGDEEEEEGDTDRPDAVAAGPDGGRPADAPAAAEPAAEGRREAAWPEGRTGFEAAGRFRAWTSEGAGSNHALGPLEGVEDVVEVYQSAAAWLVLREDGELLSQRGQFDRSGIRAIFPGDRSFVLVGIDGGLEVISVGSGHPPVDSPFDPALKFVSGFSDIATGDGVLSSLVALDEDGQLHVAGAYFEDRERAGSRFWRERPVVPPGRRAVELSASGSLLAMRLDDGTLEVWSSADGRQTLPAELSGERVREFLVARGALYALPHGEGQAMFWRRGQEEPHYFPGIPAGGALSFAYRNAVLVTEAGYAVVLENPISDASMVDPLLPYLKRLEAGRFSLRVSSMTSFGDYARMVWHDNAVAEAVPSPGDLADPSSALAYAASLGSRRVAPAPRDPSMALLVRADFRERTKPYQEARARRLGDLAAHYLGALDRAEAEATASGSLAAVEAVQEEREEAGAFAAALEALAASWDVHPLRAFDALSDASLDGLRQMRSTFEREVWRIESELMIVFDRALRDWQSDLQRDGDALGAGDLAHFREQRLALLARPDESAPRGYGPRAESAPEPGADPDSGSEP